MFINSSGERDESEIDNPVHMHDESASDGSGSLIQRLGYVVTKYKGKVQSGETRTVVIIQGTQVDGSDWRQMPNR